MKWPNDVTNRRKKNFLIQFVLGAISKKPTNGPGLSTDFAYILPMPVGRLKPAGFMTVVVVF